MYIENTSFKNILLIILKINQICQHLFENFKLKYLLELSVRHMTISKPMSVFRSI